MLLVVNAGSSSVKVALFDGLVERRRGQVAELGPEGHRAALEGLLADGFDDGITAAAHRVVHGGARLTAAVRVDEAVLAEITACIPLAPLHNPANLAGIMALRDLTPGLPQFASFDTAFHATNPEVARRYAVPARVEAAGIRRYGFHGLSYAAIVRKLTQIGPEGLPHRLLAFHLGNGASVCAVLDGQSVATSMGYSPLDGLTMGTRAGAMDGNAVLRMAELYGVAEAGRILNRESGLLGLGGASDMRALQTLGTAEAQFAVEHFCYWAVRHAGSMIAAMGGLDAVVFTGGIGENDAGVRGKILAGLDYIAAAKPCWVIAAEEERQIAAEAMTLLQG
ncbi:MAG: acetate kinase [bacterium]